jgi:hypothetical protein
MPDPIPAEQRRVIFAALVAAQDDGLGVAAARDLVASRYGVSVEQVKAIEAEGLAGGWPPLDE